MNGCSWRALWSRIAAHPFDEAGVALSFSERLARDNGWDQRHALRCIEEYRRFALLTMVAGHPVAPSDAVDQVWHLHLTYTEDYWDRFCKYALRRPLHHQPSHGGSQEHVKFQDWYRKTLTSYRRVFGEHPPSDIWPSVTARYGRVERFVRLDRSRVLVLPRPPSLHGGVRRAARLVRRLSAHRATHVVVGAMLLTLGCTAFAGPRFLSSFVAFAALVLCVARPVARLLTTRPVAEPELPVLDYYALARLAGGARRVVDLALTKLAARGVVACARGKVSLRDARYKGEHPMEQALLRPLRRSDGRAFSVSELRESASEADAQLAEQLTRAGLLASATARMLPVIIALVVPMVGVVRVLSGLMHGRPVGYIAAVTGLTLLFACMLRGAAQTHRGDAVLREHALRTPAVDPEGESLSPATLSSIALRGLSALDATPLAPLADDLIAPRLPSLDLVDQGEVYGR